MISQQVTQLVEIQTAVAMATVCSVTIGLG